MIGPKGIPKLVLELPVWSVPGLVLLLVAEEASGGTLWAGMLGYVSLGLLDADNIWSFAVTIGIAVALGLGLLMEPLAELLEMATDRLLHRHGPAVAFEWLEAHETNAAEFAEKRRTTHRLANALAVALVAGAAIHAGSGGRVGIAVALAAAGIAAAAIGAVMKTRWLGQTERLREAARP
jgi:hypothetical protein